ncbi:glycosyltransferase [Mumia xiangluensis]|uniref:Glycosyltransferase n=1 Tax=Mumia xiangluensis TaxID=1678900 RepID=A0ABW1QIC1_9ACTN
MIMQPPYRLVIVVRADPVICGHSGEARNLAEAALARGFTDIRIVTWPIDRLQEAGLPLKPLDSVLPYSPGITVERPDPVGDYKVPDGRYLAGITGRLVELFTDGVPTVALSLYLSPHTTAVTDAVRIARATGLPVDVTTVAEAVGSDVTGVVRSCIAEDRFGAAAQVLTTYLSNDVCLAVSAYTRDLVVACAEEVDARHGTRFAEQCRDRIGISYPAIDTRAYTDLDPDAVDDAVAARGLERDGYVFFLSRLAAAKGVDDLIDGYARSTAANTVRLVVAGRGPEEAELRAYAAASPVADRIIFLDDVDDAEKPLLMAGCAAFVLPSKPRPEFVETFGIALVEKMLAGGGPIVTTETGGIGEAVGDHATIVGVEANDAIATAIDGAVLRSTPADRARKAEAARAYALQFDRAHVLDGILRQLWTVQGVTAIGA